MARKRAGLFPAAFAMLALPFSRTRTEEKVVRAIYLFHRSGDPLATVASDVAPPIEAPMLNRVVAAVREFVQPAAFAAGAIQQASLRFGDDGVVAVRGRYVSACAVYRGRGDGPIRRDLTRFVREFEERNEPNLGTWAQATTLAEAASSAITGLMGAFDDSTA